MDTYGENVGWSLYRLASDEAEIGDDLAVASLVIDVGGRSPLAVVEAVVTIAMVVGSLIG